SLGILKEDKFLMERVNNHNPSFGYNTFEGFVEEDCVQALEQLVNEGLFVAKEASNRWKESDNGMHVLAAALYVLMTENGYNKRKEVFRDFLIRMFNENKLVPGNIDL